jgi:N-acetylglutamate synthase
MQVPPVGSRVMVRYRLPAGSVPPLTDAIGHLVATGPTLQVRTKRGDVVSIPAEDVVVMKTLAAAPVRTADIRNLEHAAALAWPGIEQERVNGWLLRFGHGVTRRANSAVPLNVSVNADVSPIVDWYAARNVPPLVAAPDRLIRVPSGQPSEAETLVMTRDLAAPPVQTTSPVTLASRPDNEWLQLYRRRVPVDVLTAVIDGELTFATIHGTAVGRAAITESPDGTRWLGLSAVHVVEEARRHGSARAVTAELLAWGAEHGTSRAYVQVLVDNTPARRLFESAGFAAHHRSRYIRADTRQNGGGS